MMQEAQVQLLSEEDLQKASMGSAHLDKHPPGNLQHSVPSSSAAGRPVQMRAA